MTKPVAGSRQGIDPDPGAHGQLETLRVRLQVVGHLVLGGVGGPRGGEAHPGQPVVARRGEQAQRVPAGAPRVADAVVGVEDHERQAPAGQVVADRQPALAAAHDDRVDPFDLVSAHRCSSSQRG